MRCPINMLQGSCEFSPTHLPWTINGENPFTKISGVKLRQRRVFLSMLPGLVNIQKANLNMAQSKSWIYP